MKNSNLKSGFKKVFKIVMKLCLVTLVKIKLLVKTRLYLPYKMKCLVF